MLAIDKNNKPNAHHLLEMIISESSDLVYVKDLFSRFILVNTTTAKFMGAESPYDLIGKSDFDFYPQELASKFLQDEQEILVNGKPILDIEERSYLKNGEMRWLSTSKIPMKDEEGKIIGLIGIGRDITSRKRYKEKIGNQTVEIAHQSGKIELANNVLHNVGNVLNSINVGVSEILKAVDTSKVQNIFKVAQLFETNIDHIEEFISKNPKGKVSIEYLLKVSKEVEGEKKHICQELEEIVKYVESIKSILDIQQDYTRSYDLLSEASLISIIDSALSIQGRFFQNRGVVSIVNVPHNMMVKCDKSKIIHVFINLLKNAAEAMDNNALGNKIITINAWTENDKHTVLVEDKGVGINEENLKRIFNHGFTTKKEGTGFGLHSCAISMLEAGGYIKAYSDGIGKGATFELVFPKPTLQKED